MSAQSPKADDASYHLVERGGELWPAVICEEDMIPVEEMEVRPSGYYRAVLVLGVFEFKWVLERDLYEFDPSVSQRIPAGPEKRQLQEAFYSVLGSPDMASHPFYPGLGYWRDALLARDVQNHESSSSDDIDDVLMLPTPPRRRQVTLSHHKTVIPPSAKDSKRPWAKFKLDKQFGEEFGHGRKKVKTDSKKYLSHWLPGEDPNAAEDMPPPDYFSRIKKEKEAAALRRGDSDSDVSDEDSSEADSESDSEADSGAEEDDEEDISDDEKEDRADQASTQRPQPRIKEKSETAVSKTSRQHTSPSTSRLRSNESRSNRTREERGENNPEITQLCRRLDTARAESCWEQAEEAASQLAELAPWSNADTIWIAKVAFRVPPRLDVEDNFEHSLRDAVAEHIQADYDHFREIFNGPVALLFREYEDLAEMVYERRLEALREKRRLQGLREERRQELREKMAGAVEISDSE